MKSLHCKVHCHIYIFLRHKSKIIWIWMQQENILLTAAFLIIVQYILIKYHEFSLKAIQHKNSDQNFESRLRESYQEHCVKRNWVNYVNSAADETLTFIRIFRQMKSWRNEKKRPFDEFFPKISKCLQPNWLVDLVADLLLRQL